MLRRSVSSIREDIVLVHALAQFYKHGFAAARRRVSMVAGPGLTLAFDFRWPPWCQGVEIYFPVCALAPRVLWQRTRTMLHCQSVSLTVIYGLREVEIEAAGGITVVTRRNTMTKSFDKKQIGLAAACALALGILSGAAFAQSATIERDAKDRTYVEDNRDAIVRSGFGLCWHTGFGPPPASGPECDPKIVAYVAPPVPKSEPVPAPAMVQPPVVAAAPEAPPKVYEPPQRPARKDRN